MSQRHVTWSQSAPALGTVLADSPGVCAVHRLGVAPYLPTWDLQRALARARRDERIPDTLLLVQHPHTFTLGRRGKSEHVLIDATELERLEIGVHEIDRGGEVTYHGPGQLVCYPIVKLDRWGRDIRQYMRNLEEVVLRALAVYGIASTRVAGMTGVWAGQEKIAAIGVRVAYWVTTHGFALNVDPDLAYFRRIVPCGITDKDVTSMARLLGRPPDMAEVEDAVVAAFGQVLELEMVEEEGAGTLEIKAEAAEFPNALSQ